MNIFLLKTINKQRLILHHKTTTTKEVSWGTSTLSKRQPFITQPTPTQTKSTETHQTKATPSITFLLFPNTNWLIPNIQHSTNPQFPAQMGGFESSNPPTHSFPTNPENHPSTTTTIKGVCIQRMMVSMCLLSLQTGDDGLVVMGGSTGTQGNKENKVGSCSMQRVMQDEEHGMHRTLRRRVSVWVSWWAQQQQERRSNGGWFQGGLVKGMWWRRKRRSGAMERGSVLCVSGGVGWRRRQGLCLGRGSVRAAAAAAVVWVPVAIAAVLLHGRNTLVWFTSDTFFSPCTRLSCAVFVFSCFVITPVVCMNWEAQGGAGNAAYTAPIPSRLMVFSFFFFFLFLFDARNSVWVLAPRIVGDRCGLQDCVIDLTLSFKKDLRTIRRLYLSW